VIRASWLSSSVLQAARFAHVRRHLCSGGLTVAAVLKYADAVLKGYATAISVLLTGVLSMVLFGTELSVEYALGMTNVLAAVFLYNAQDLEKHAW
jgi:hypothetical protein